jgi:hypothetical protein
LKNDSESTARVAMFSSASPADGAVVYPDTDTIWLWTDDDAVDVVVERSSALGDAAPRVTVEERRRVAEPSPAGVPK